MRDRVAAALLGRIGQQLTRELALQIAREILLDPEQAHDPAKFGSQRCGSLTFHVERLRTVLPELIPLHDMHWQETEAYRHGLGLNPDYG